MTSTTRVRLAPDTRREQLLDLGVRLLSTRSLDELSIDLLAEEAGISRGLLYHYFGNKQDFHVAVARRAVADLFAQTAPPTEGTPLERLRVAQAAYVDYVVENYEGYVSLVRGAGGGNQALREVYEEARAALTGRLFQEQGDAGLLPDTPGTRLMVRAWSAMSEELVLAWVRDPAGVSRDQLLDALTDSLPALAGLVR